MAIYALGDIEPQIHPEAYIHPDAVVIGAVVIGAFSTVWPHAVLRGDSGTITVGSRTSIQDGSVIHTTDEFSTVIGDEVTVGHLVHMEGCTIEDRALVGSGSIVLHEVVVGSDSIVGANAVVSNRTIVPPLSMALGVPAKIRENAVQKGHHVEGVEYYVSRGIRYRNELRRLG